MNTGIQDGANLGWKLALGARGAPDSLLDTYASERRPVARQVVRITGVAFALEVSDLLPLRWARRWAAAPVAALLLSHNGLLSAVARLVSGLDTSYRRGALGRSPGLPPRSRPGRRFPDRPVEHPPEGRIHRALDASGFHLVLFEDMVDQEALVDLQKDHGEVLQVHWLDRPARPVLRCPAYVLVRPDGYIAASGNDLRLENASGYLRTWLGDQFAAARSTL